jgi:cyclohexanone monooxygenase
MATGSQDKCDAVVVGAGFGGVQMLYELKKLGLTACGIEGGSDVGGAWYWNAYPGARCDVESLLYCYSFCPTLDANWRWSERYPAQPEIQRYIGFAADTWDVRRDIRFNSWVRHAAWNESDNRWTVELDNCDKVSGKYLIMATGPLTTVVWPDIPGFEAFKGERYHTARWPKGVSLAGKRIGVIGNGSSGTQFMTEAAKTAGELHAFLRSAQYSVPALNRPLTVADLARWDAEKERIRSELHQGIVNGSGDTFADRSVIFNTGMGADYTPEEQQARMETYWNMGGASLIKTFQDIMFDETTNDIVGDFVRAKVRSIVTNPRNVETIMPRHFRFGGKRLIVDTGFYEIFNQPNVFAHDIREHPIVRITENGIETSEGETELDMLVFATGFDAATGTFARMDIRGRGGRSLNDYWNEQVRSVFGLSVSNFPNMLMVNGPGAPGPFSNVVISNEWCIEAIVAIIGKMEEAGIATVEADPAVEKKWMALVDQLISPTFFAKTDNWYNKANVNGVRGKIVNFADPATYRQKVVQEREAGFPSFVFEKATAAA